MFELNHVSGTSNLLNGMMGDTPATDNILGLEPVQNWNPGSGGPTLDVSTLNPGALTNLQGTVLPEETVQIALTTGTTDDIDPVTRESSTPVELTGEAGDRLFDAEYYAQINPDLSAAGLNTLPQLFQHFKTHGLGEGRGFSLWTNLEHYAAQNPDLETAGLTLHEQIYQHLQTFGLAEGREFSPWVDLQYYLDNNADLKAAFGEDTAQAFEHLQIFGLEEGRRFSPKLDLNYYLSHYSDLSAEFGDNKKLAFGHLQQFGVAEGRQFLPEIPEAATAESTEVESSAIDEQTQEGISIVFETQTTPTTSIPTASDVEEETNTSGDLDPLPDESETAASVSIEVEEETIPDTSDEVEEETIPDTSDEVEEETIPDTFDEVEEDEGNAIASDDEVEAEQLSPTVTLSQTLMGLEEEPTPPLDLPENAGGANAKKNPAPKHLKLDATQEEYYQGGTVRLNGWIFDASGANDVERVEFSLHKTGEQWEEIESWTTFNISTKDDRWAYFDYSTFGLEPGKYQIKGFAYDSEGGKSNAAVAHFSVSAENPLPLVGVIDTGFNAKNIDIDYKRAALGTDFVDGDDNPLLEEGEGSEHGTHTLGIIGATQNNGVGIYGINDQAPLWLSRAIGSGKWGDALIEFVDYAIASEQPTAIANLSLDLTQVESDGSIKTRYEFTPKEREALEYARQNGILVVVAAGNDGTVMSVLGQASQEFDNIITVGATNGNQRADYSSYGRRGPDIMAEGGSSASPILSTAGEDVGTMAGTSIAAAQVTGVASLVWEANPELNYRQIIEALKSTATDLNIPGEDSETGAGLVNPDAAVEKAKQMTPEDYDPEDFLTPDTWGGEGLVTPEERAVEFNYPIEPASFSGTVNPEIGVNLRYSNSFDDHSDQNVAYGETLYFDAWTYGEVGNDYWNNDAPDALWYRLEGKDLWVPSVYIAGYPPTYPPLLPPEGFEQTQDGGDDSTFTPPGDSLIVYDETGNIVEIGGGSTGYGDSGTTNSEPSAPSFEIYDRFKGAYDKYDWLGEPIGDPYISSSGFVIQYFENAYLVDNGSNIIPMYQDEVEGVIFDSVPSNEPIPSVKGNLIRTGGGERARNGVEATETDPKDYIGWVTTKILPEPGNEGKEHLVIIDWGTSRWQGVVSPGLEGQTLWYKKTEQEEVPRRVVVAKPDETDGFQMVISENTKIENEIASDFVNNENNINIDNDPKWKSWEENSGDRPDTPQVYALFRDENVDARTNAYEEKELDQKPPGYPYDYPSELTTDRTFQELMNHLIRQEVPAGAVTNGYLDRYKHNGDYDIRFHGGFDLAIEQGTMVYSVVGGKVIGNGTYWGVSYFAVHNANLGKTFLYLHMINNQNIQVGTSIPSNTFIGNVSDKGTPGAVHLHFEVQDDAELQYRYQEEPSNFWVKKPNLFNDEFYAIETGVLASNNKEEIRKITDNPLNAFVEAKYQGEVVDK
ncbi:S8 family serine peptidase [Laspinema sp. D1]|uniref:S8 family serine peptidase n=1 Tax=Laspinema palackyanum TaxID=3231601 RepID=UPI0034993A5C|nr:S8 family serine peptidase [Laspinema sp. D2b]